MWTRIVQPDQFKKLQLDRFFINALDDDLPAEPERSNPVVYQLKEVGDNFVILYQSTKNSYTLSSFPMQELLNGEWWIWKQP